MTEAYIHRLQAHRYDIAVDARHGASLASLKWQKPGGDWFEILHPCPPAEIARTGGSFVMAPFTNRLDAGRFPDASGLVQVPVNRPEMDMAVHGFSRDRSWRVVEAFEGCLTLVDDFEGHGNPFAYSLTQQISIGPEGVELSLRLVNNAASILPYGIGFHPWFHKEADTWLRFEAATLFSRDERGFAVAPLPASEGPDFSSGIDVATMPWFDRHFSGWRSGKALIDWRRQGARLTLSGTGALANLHVYVPDDRPILCVEPVSHVPDAHNRRHLAGYGDVAWLSPREAIEGSMQLVVEDLSTL